MDSFEAVVETEEHQSAGDELEERRPGIAEPTRDELEAIQGLLLVRTPLCSSRSR